jgi:hypothetical protein
MKAHRPDYLGAIRYHCCGSFRGKPKGPWVVDELDAGSGQGLAAAFVRCQASLQALNRTGISRKRECVLLDCVFELNYRTVTAYLRGTITRQVLRKLEKTNYFVQGIVCRDVVDLEAHYRLQRSR